MRAAAVERPFAFRGDDTLGIALTLPMPPSANRLWARTRVGMGKSAAYAKWLRDAGFVALAQHQKPVKGPYKISIHAKRPEGQGPDLDNLIKPLNDLLQSLRLIENDKLCEMVTARWVTGGLIGVFVLVDPAGVE